MREIYIPSKANKSPIKALGFGILCAVSTFAVLPILQAIPSLMKKPPQIEIAQTSAPQKDFIIPKDEPKEKDVEELDEIEMEKPEVTITLADLEAFLNPSDNGVGVSTNINMINNALDTSIKEFLLSELDSSPKVLVAVKPLYPYSMKGVSGRVMVEFVIDENGKVLRARAIDSSDREFVAAAIQAVKRSKWEPGRKDNQAVRTIVRLPVEFNK